MEILVLSNCPVVETQGSGYVIANTVKSLTDLGHRVDVVPPDTLYVLPSWESRARNYRMAIGMAKWVFTNRRKLARYQLVLVYGAESAFAVFVLKKILGLSIPVVLHSNGLELHGKLHMKATINGANALRWYHFDQSWIFRYCYRHVDAIITVSEFERDFAVKQLQLPPQKMFFLEPSLPDVFFNHPVSASASKKPIIAYCGTWILRKGVEVIKEVIPDILRKYPEYRFRIIGTGKEFLPEQHFPPGLLSRIDLHPFVATKEEMIKLYSEAEIFLFPSFYESFGLVVAEAMFCGCATVCSRTGFAAHVKNETEALVLEDVDAQQVREALERLLTGEALRKKIAANGQKRTALLRWSLYTTKLGQILENIPAAAGKGRIATRTIGTAARHSA